MFTYIDVILRAVQVIENGDAPFSWSDHGECCPWCAVAIAKNELDEVFGSGVSDGKAREDILSGEVEEVASDDPLIFARKALAKWEGVDPYSITKAQALDILAQAKSVIVIDG